jgi:hypothetical protein
MGEWMTAEVHVRVPDDAHIERWLHLPPDRHRPDLRILDLPHDDRDKVVPAPVRDLLATATEADFVWAWEPERRLLSSSGSELEVNYGLDDQFAHLAAALRDAGWGYCFESAGKYEYPGEYWEWMPGWPRERTFVHVGGTKAFDPDRLHDALAEADTLGADPAEHLTALLAPWPGWTTPPSPTG